MVFIVLWNKNRFCIPGVSHGTKFVFTGCSDPSSWCKKGFEFWGAAGCQRSLGGLP